MRRPASCSLQFRRCTLLRRKTCPADIDAIKLRGMLLLFLVCSRGGPAVHYLSSLTLQLAIRPVHANETQDTTQMLPILSGIAVRHLSTFALQLAILSGHPKALRRKSPCRRSILSRGSCQEFVIHHLLPTTTHLAVSPHASHHWDDKAPCRSTTFCRVVSCRVEILLWGLGRFATWLAD